MDDILRAVSASGHHKESGGDQWPECQLWRFSLCLGNHARTRSGGQRNRTQFLSLPPRASSPRSGPSPEQVRIEENTDIARACKKNIALGERFLCAAINWPSVQAS